MVWFRCTEDVTGPPKGGLILLTKRGTSPLKGNSWIFLLKSGEMLIKCRIKNDLNKHMTKC